MRLPTIRSFLFLLTVSSPLFAWEQVTFHNRLVEGSKVWVPEPKSFQMQRNQPVEIRLVNYLNEPHGFYIPGMTDALTVPASPAGRPPSEMKFSVIPNKAGKQEFKCHLHPAHVGGNFTVL